MDSANTKIAQSARISVSRNIALLIISLFLAAVIITGIVVYHVKNCESSVNCQTTCTKSQDAEFCNCPTNNDFKNDFHTTTDFTSVFPYDSDKEDGLVTDVRLPRSVKPISYELKLIPFIYENFTFHGEVSIIFNVTESCHNVTLHAVDLDIVDDSVSLSRIVGNSSVNIGRTTNDSARQFFIVHVDEELQEGQQYAVRMSFTGVLNDLLQGFYRSSYSVDNETRWIAATQFQATDARRTFPCFDEPALKAIFKISLARPNNMSTISNMPKLERSEPVDGIDNYSWDHYNESLPMSTYLVAFVVSDFDHITNKSLSIWARSSAINQAKFGLQIGPSILEYYEDFFQIKFPLPKIDMIALPDFSAGAMENWGLITYRESVLLYEEGVSTIANLQSIAIVMAHELAHQWFGNLVTPSWWTDLWLNEGFATYLENVGTDAVKPEWRLIDQFVVHDLQNVFALDVLNSSHQISIEVGNPDEINEIFDKISYAKGASIIRMMEHFLSTSVFKNGLTNYLNERKYDSATQDDLWSALTLEAHKQDTLPANLTVKEIMDTWTLQTGFPVVSVIRNYLDETASISQSRFNLERKVLPEKWWIPITYGTNNLVMNSTWISPKYDATLDYIKPENWLLVNVNQTGYYRVNYDSENWLKLTRELLNARTFAKSFDPKNRAQLIDDAMNLASSGYLDYNVALNLTKYLVNERDYVPWRAAFTAFDYIGSMFVRTGHYDRYKKFMTYLLDNVYNDLGFKDGRKDTQLQIYTRKAVLVRACTVGNLGCIGEAVLHFRNWKISPNPDVNNPINPNLKELVYCTAIRVGDQTDWEFAWDRFINSNVGSEREIIMTALGCSRETWILTRYLERAITDGSSIRKQDAFRVFNSVTENTIGQELAFRFLRVNWDRIRKYMGSSILALNGIVKAVTNKLSTRDDVRELKAFALSKASDLGSANRTVQQSIELVQDNIRWMDENFDVIKNWLETTSL